MAVIFQRGFSVSYDRRKLNWVLYLVWPLSTAMKVYPSKMRSVWNRVEEPILGPPILPLGSGSKSAIFHEAAGKVRYPSLLPWKTWISKERAHSSFATRKNTTSPGSRIVGGVYALRRPFGFFTTRRTPAPFFKVQLEILVPCGWM